MINCKRQIYVLKVVDWDPTVNKCTTDLSLFTDTITPPLLCEGKF